MTDSGLAICFSAANDFKGIFDDPYIYRYPRSISKFQPGNEGQRKVLELAYVEKALGEMRRSLEKILAAFEKDPKVTDAKDPAKESYCFIHDYLSHFLEIGGEFRNVSQKKDASLSTIEQWEKREESRGLRSRWSHKDEKRHGAKLKNITAKCKLIVQQLRVQQSRFREQRRIADQ